MSQLNQNSIALEELKTMAASLPAAITIDSTLTQEGQAADSKAVGDALAEKADIATGIYVAQATSSNGVQYQVTVPGLTSLVAGMYLTIIPNRMPILSNPYLNVNSLGNISMARGYYGSTTVATNFSPEIMSPNTPITVKYNGTYWVIVDPALIKTSSISGTFGGTIYAQSSTQAPATSLLRNSSIVSADTNPTNNGEICWTYE